MPESGFCAHSDADERRATLDAFGVRVVETKVWAANDNARRADQRLVDWTRPNINAAGE